MAGTDNSPGPPEVQGVWPGVRDTRGEHDAQDTRPVNRSDLVETSHYCELFFIVLYSSIL